MEATRASLPKRALAVLMAAIIAIAIAFAGGGVTRAEAVDTGGSDPTRIFDSAKDGTGWYAWSTSWCYVKTIDIAGAKTLSYEWDGNTCNISLHGEAQVGDTIKLNTNIYARSGSAGINVNGTKKGGAGNSFDIVLQEGATRVTVQPYYSSRTGTTKTLNITIDETTAKKCTGIAVTTPPTKTAYHEGDAFDPTGMVVTATYEDNTTAEIPNDKLVFTPVALTPDTTAVTIALRDVTTTQPVTVAALTGIEVTTPPTKTEYFETQKFKPEGMVVTATYSDETTAIIPLDKCTFAPMDLVEGNSIITITYAGKTTTQAITTGPVPSYIGLINYATSKGSLDLVTITHTDGTPFEDCVVTVDGTTINVAVGRSEGFTPTLRATFSLTQAGGFPYLSYDNSWIFASSRKRSVYDTTIANATGKATAYLYNADPGVLSNNYTTFTVNYTIANNLPVLAEGVSASVEKDIALGKSVSVDVDSLFTDPDGDDLTYQVSIDGKAPVTVGADGWADFRTEGRSVAVWVREGAFEDLVVNE